LFLVIDNFILQIYEKMASKTNHFSEKIRPRFGCFFEKLEARES
jgi:hypothetical protein